MKRERIRTVGLCLSGGGYRATLFHLGALRRLNELGILQQLTTISAVSGGSIAAAFLALKYDWGRNQRYSAAEWDDLIARPLIDFTSRNLRTPTLIKGYALLWLSGLTWRGAVVWALARAYKPLFGKATFSDLPESPRFIFCSSDLGFGVGWVFERQRTGSYQAGYKKPTPKDYSLCQAVAASSAFPPVFRPMPSGFHPKDLKGGKYRGVNRSKVVRGLEVTDGGLYDNLGLEHVWGSHDFVLASDGGALVLPDWDKGWRWRLGRYLDIQGNQSSTLRKRWLRARYEAKEFGGAYWGVGSAQSSYKKRGLRGYSKKIAVRFIGTVRTDLDAFSDGEAEILQNHGYLVADAAVRVKAPELLLRHAPKVSVPYPNVATDAAAMRALAESSARRWFGHWGKRCWAHFLR